MAVLFGNTCRIIALTVLALTSDMLLKCVDYCHNVILIISDNSEIRCMPCAAGTRMLTER